MQILFLQFGLKKSPGVVELPQQSEFHGAIVRPNLSTMDLSQCPMVRETYLFISAGIWHINWYHMHMIFVAVGAFAAST
jgi:hypothetical protein